MVLRAGGPAGGSPRCPWTTAPRRPLEGDRHRARHDTGGRRHAPRPRRAGVRGRPDRRGRGRRALGPRGRLQAGGAVARWRHVRRRARDPALVPHDPRRAAPVGPRGRRLGGRLPGRHRAAPGRPRVAPGDVRSWLPPDPPERPEPFADVLADLDRVVVPGTTHWQHPGFHAYFPANTSGPGILADIVSSGLGTQGMLWQTGPACTEVETHVLDWVVDLLALPDAVPVGRRRAAGSSRTRPRRPPCAPCWRPASGRSGRAPTSTGWWCTPRPRPTRRWRRAPAWPGSRPDQVRLIDVDDAHRPAGRPAGRRGRRGPGGRARAVPGDGDDRHDQLAGRRPGGGDRADRRGRGDVAARGRRHGRLGGRVPRVPRPAGRGSTGRTASCSTRTSGCSRRSTARASTWPTGAALLDALSILPEFLRNAASESGAVVDYRDWQVPLGRRFRALKLWFVLRWYGAEGLRHHVREHVRLAGELAARIDADPRLELAAPGRAEPRLLPPRRRRRRHRGAARGAERHRAACTSPTPGWPTAT